MHRTRIELSTGLPKLDRVLRGIMPGDNIVWQVETIEDYRFFVQPYAEYAAKARQKLLYLRFGKHEPLLEPGAWVQREELDPAAGFKSFIAATHRLIDDAGRGALVLFDCLSNLAPDWNSDRMLGNFFMLTCPHLYDRAAIAYFAVLRNYHSFHAIKPITATTQILIESFQRKGRRFIQPLKVQYRNSPTMYMLHTCDNGNFIPVTQSATITETLAGLPWSREKAANDRLGVWGRTFLEAEAVQAEVERGNAAPGREQEYFQRLLRMLISREPAVLRLAETYFTLKDMLNIRARMIGTGMIGGKAVGMLLSRAIMRAAGPRWEELLEPHDSFFVGADVFCTYLVQNGCWWMMRMRPQGLSPEDESETVRRRIRAGEFPEYILSQFADLLEYFGQSPIIVRSSSLLEDNFGNAFAGKYESCFCANQGSHDKRLEDFICAVRTVYASIVSQDALEYRIGRGLMGNDEQMGLLIQRVSGSPCGSLFFPHAAGVALSFNPYVWNEKIDPRAGLLRLVFGMGTRAVDRSDDDYTRIVALNAPFCRPEANFGEVVQHSQRRVDVIDTEANQLTSLPFEHIIKSNRDIPIEMFASHDPEYTGRREDAPWFLTFEKLLAHTPFVEDMQDMLQTLQRAYGCPVDTEFALNFFEAGRYRLNLLQCRPLQVTPEGADAQLPENVAQEDTLLEARGAVIGHSLALDIDWFIYVVPSAYSSLPDHERYQVARAIAAICAIPEVGRGRIMLLGPGRWGTTTPSLGVPVVFSDIAKVAILCEIVEMHANLIPDVSLGTHFFNDIVENDMLYMALFPDRSDNRLERDFFEDATRSVLPVLLPELAKEWKDVIRLIDVRLPPEGKRIRISADLLKQRAICYRT